MRKTFLSAIVSICLIFCVSVPAVAFASAGDNLCQPQWANVSSIFLTMNYSGGAVNWTGEINGYSGTTKTYLYKAASKTAAKGTYRLNVTANVTGSSGTETVTDSLVKTL